MDSRLSAVDVDFGIKIVAMLFLKWSDIYPQSLPCACDAVLSKIAKNQLEKHGRHSEQILKW